MGPQHDELGWPGNMAGAEFLPQASLLPQVDLVVTHGGNNTVTECLHFGLPMIVLPIFWDQYDNAQRVHETGFGVRLDTYGFADERADGRDRPVARRRALEGARGGRREAAAGCGREPRAPRR